MLRYTYAVDGCEGNDEKTIYFFFIKNVFCNHMQVFSTRGKI